MESVVPDPRALGSKYFPGFYVASRQARMATSLRFFFSMTRFGATAVNVLEERVVSGQSVAAATLHTLSLRFCRISTLCASPSLSLSFINTASPCAARMASACLFELEQLQRCAPGSQSAEC